MNLLQIRFWTHTVWSNSSRDPPGPRKADKIESKVDSYAKVRVLQVVSILHIRAIFKLV